MPTACSPALFDSASVEGRRVVAAFDGGAITSNAGALLLGRAWLAQRAAGATLGHPEHRLHMPHASRAALGA